MTKKTYKMKKELKPIGPLTSGPLKGKMLEPGVDYKDGDFPAAYRHMFDEVKSETSKAAHHRDTERGMGKVKSVKAEDAGDEVGTSTAVHHRDTERGRGKVKDVKAEGTENAEDKEEATD